jgi:hypothetical protein
VEGSGPLSDGQLDEANVWVARQGRWAGSGWRAVGGFGVACMEAGGGGTVLLTGAVLFTIQMQSSVGMWEGERAS